MQRPLFRRFDALAVDDRCRRTGLASRLLTAQHVQRVVDTIERSVRVPAPQIVVHRAPWRQVLRQRRPLAASAQDVHDPVDHRALIDGPPVAAALGGWDQRGDDRPFFVGQIARVAQLAAVVFRPVLGRPHGHPSPGSHQPRPVTTDSNHAICSRTDTYSYCVIEFLRACAVSAGSRGIAGGRGRGRW